MRELLKRIRGTEEPEDFYEDLGFYILILLVSVAALVFGRGEQKWAGVFGLSIALMIGLPRIFRKKGD